MQSTDREEFDAQMLMLCQGYDRPVGDRGEAYWKGLAKMTLVEFARVVEHCLSEEGPPKFPTTHVIWGIHRSLKHRPVHTIEQAKRPTDDRDTLKMFADRLILKLMFNRGGLGSTGKFVPGHGMVNADPSAALTKCRQAVHSLVDWFSPSVAEGDENATPALFIEMLTKALDSELDDKTRKVWAHMAAMPEAAEPFPSWMARDYVPLQQLELT